LVVSKIVFTFGHQIKQLRPPDNLLTNKIEAMKAETNITPP